MPSVLGIVPYAGILHLVQYHLVLIFIFVYNMLLLLGIDLMVFFSLKEHWMKTNKAKGNIDKGPDVLTLVIKLHYASMYILSNCILMS